MNITSIVKEEADYKSVLGIDIATSSIGFGSFVSYANSWRLDSWGKIEIEGETIYDKCFDTKKKFTGLCKSLLPDLIVIESSIYVNNNNVMKNLSMMMGVVIVSGMSSGSDIREVPPITWQSFIGNKSFTKEEKERIAREHNTSSESQLKKAMREERKGRTISFVEKTFDKSISDNDVSDAICIAYYGYKNFAEQG